MDNMQHSKRAEVSEEFLTDASLSEENIEWLLDTNRSLEDVITDARYRDEFEQEFADLLHFCASSETHRRILAELVFNEGITYDNLINTTGKTRRTVKGHVRVLRELGIIKVVRSSMAIISLTDTRLKIVIGEVLALHRLASKEP